MEELFDKIPLPSRGVQYTHLPEDQREYVKVTYLTAEDENLFFSPNLIESNTLVETLINRKIKTDGLTYKTMLEGDVNAILFWLRSGAYGPEYQVKLKDPKTGEMFDHVVNLSELKYLTPNLELNGNGRLEFKFPICEKVVEYRYLTIGEEMNLEANDLAKTSKKGSTISTLMTDRMTEQIISVDGTITDRMEIRRFVNNLRPMDSKAFRKHLADNEIGVDVNLNVEAPSGAMFQDTLPLGATFFYPDLSV